mgnify:CR=1 FL=1
MFANLFNTLSSLSNSTKILEACDWSEERARDLVLFCASAMQEISDSGTEIASLDDLEEALSSYLISTHTPSEISILLEVIKDEMASQEKIHIGEC